MRKKQKLLMLALASGAVSLAVGPSIAKTVQSWNEADVVYAYDYYADETKTEYLGSASDTCTVYGVTNPYLPTNYYDRRPLYVCTSFGPYLPPDWPY